jgi:hypothetical protein
MTTKYVKVDNISMQPVKGPFYNQMYRHAIIDWASL